MTEIGIGVRVDSEAGREALKNVGTDVKNFSATMKESGTVVQQSTSTGIAGFEQLRRKTVELRSEYVAHRQELMNLQAAFKSGAITEAEFAAQSAKVTTAMQQSRFAMRTATQEMGAIRMQGMLALEPMRMMAESFGVQIPAGIGMMLSRFPQIQTAMEGLFSVSIIGMFVGEGIKLTKELWDYMEERISKLTPELKDQLDQIHALNQAISGALPQLPVAMQGRSLADLQNEQGSLWARRSQIESALALAGEGVPGAASGVDLNELKNITARLAELPALINEAQKHMDAYAKDAVIADSTITKFLTDQAAAIRSQQDAYDLDKTLAGRTAAVALQRSREMAAIPWDQRQATGQLMQSIRLMDMMVPLPLGLAGGRGLARISGYQGDAVVDSIRKQMEVENALAAVQKAAHESQIHNLDLEMQQRERIREFQRRDRQGRAISTVWTDFSRGIATAITDAKNFGGVMQQLGIEIINTIIRAEIESQLLPMLMGTNKGRMGGWLGTAGTFLGGLLGHGTSIAASGAAGFATGESGLILPQMALAGGGDIPPGGFALVGENGPEIASGGASGTSITPLNKVGRSVVNNFYQDFRGADAGVEHRVAAGWAAAVHRASVRDALYAQQEASLRMPSH